MNDTHIQIEFKIIVSDRLVYLGLTSGPTPYGHIICKLTSSEAKRLRFITNSIEGTPINSVHPMKKRGLCFTNDHAGVYNLCTTRLAA